MQMPIPWPKYIIIKVGKFTSHSKEDAFQIAGRTGFDPDEGAYWYDTKMVESNNDPTTLSTAKARLHRLQMLEPPEKERRG